ncbi:MAG: 4Fe-4S dicluster domain-containing protein [Clostridia bacterium]|jgi:coenzyme F420-reducing hydrogenase beta subunit|nr:4Fe-4S dicluster domain-containing protein [Clostridia bacterium]
MSDMQAKLRETAKKLLESGEVGYIIGWGKGRTNKTSPVFVKEPAKVDELVWNEYCLNTLAKYTMDNMYPEKKIGLCVRGCDSRAVNRLIQDNQLKRENVYLIGLPCEGKKDPVTGEMVKKCIECMHHNPLEADVMVGEPVQEKGYPDRFKDVEAMEALSADERYEFWAKQYDKCIRCYACRNVCPACNCRECYVDQYRVGWQGKQNNRAENQVYGLTRAYHIGDRCIECGECERVCPVGLPLMKLNRKLLKDANELFGEYEAGMNTEVKPPLGTYKLDDHEEYM